MQLLVIRSILLPWPLKRRVLNSLAGWDLHENARIGFALVNVGKLSMERGARIHAMSVIKNLTEVSLATNAYIGPWNWISCSPPRSGQFRDIERRRELRLGDESAITMRHYIDCNDSVTIGSHSTLAGVRSQVLTHSIDLSRSEQRTRPVTIGDYCFIGSGSIITGGSNLADYIVVGAGSVTIGTLPQSYAVYRGNPAVFERELDKDIGYFVRGEGSVR